MAGETIACHSSVSVINRWRTLLFILLISYRRLVDGRALTSSGNRVASSSSAASAAASDGEAGLAALPASNVLLASISLTPPTPPDYNFLHNKENRPADAIRLYNEGERTHVDINDENSVAANAGASLENPSPYRLKNDDDDDANVNSDVTDASESAKGSIASASGDNVVPLADDNGRNYNRALLVSAREGVAGRQLRDEGTGDGKEEDGNEEEIDAAADRDGASPGRVYEQLTFTRLYQKRKPNPTPVSELVRDAESSPNSKIGILGLDNLDYTVTMLDLKRQREQNLRTRTANATLRTSQRSGNNLRTGSRAGMRRGSAANFTSTRSKSAGEVTPTTPATDRGVSPSDDSILSVGEEELQTALGSRQRGRQPPNVSRTPVRPNGRVLPKTVNFAQLRDLLRRLENAG